MKLNKSSIFALMTLGGLLVFGPVAGAQDQTNNPSNPPAGAGGARRGPPSPERIMEQLKLTDDEKEKVKPILVDQADKMKALQSDQSLSRQEKQPKRKEIHDATAAKLKPILTDEQYAQWEKMSQMGGRRRPSANNPPADAPAPPPAAPPASGDKN